MTDISSLARLARLQLSSGEAERYGEEFDRIVEFVGQIEKAGDTPFSDSVSVTPQMLRDDVVIPSELADSLLDQAPDRGGSGNRLVRVPQVFS